MARARQYSRKDLQDFGAARFDGMTLPEAMASIRPTWTQAECKRRVLYIARHPVVVETMEKLAGNMGKSPDERLLIECENLLASKELKPRDKLSLINTSQQLRSRIDAQRQDYQTGPCLREFIADTLQVLR